MSTAIYARQSINKKDSISIETQIEICKKEVMDSGDVKIYTDKGFSGKNISRPAFQRMMADIEEGGIEAVVVYRLDRISRSVVDFAGIIEILNKHNVGFISANEKFDTASPAGKAMLYIIMVFAQLERETIAERIKDNYYQRGSEGVWMGGPAPFGFDNIKIPISGKRVATIIENADIELVKQIYKDYSSTDDSLGTIAKRLTKERGEMWNNIKLARILHNPAYVKADVDVYSYFASLGCIIESDITQFNGINGLNIYGKRDRSANKYNNLKDHHVTVGIHNGVIPSYMWLNCQYKLSKNTQIKNSGKGKHTWLTGLVKCGKCGHAFVVRLYKDKKYFNCSGRAIGICSGEVTTHYVDEIESLVSAKLKEHLNELPKNNVVVTETDDSDKTNKLKMELIKIEKEIDGIVGSLSSANDILIKYANAKITKLDEERTKILNAISENTKKTTKLPDIPDISDWENQPNTLKKDIANLFIDKILIYDNSIEIKWKH